MRVTLRQIALLGLISVCCGFLSAPTRADVLFSVTDLGAASPTADATGNQSPTSGTYPYLTGQGLVPSNGNYLSALSAGQQAAFRSGSFDLYTHPATTNLTGLGFYPHQNVPGYDVGGPQLSDDEVSGFQMTTRNNLGVTVGTAGESIASGIFNRLVEFTPDPHTVTQQGSGGPPQVQSPGYVNVLWTQSQASISNFWGTATGINDHNNIAFNQFNYVGGPSGGFIGLVAPHALIGGEDTPLGSLGGTNGAAYALNNSNEVVGWSQIANGASHAFLYANGTMEDLNLLIAPLSGITLTSAVGIDAAGEIVAYGTDASGQSHEYLLTPAEAPVPEPSTLAVMGLMIIAMAARQARARSATR